MDIQKPEINYNGTLTPLNPNNIKYIVVHHAEAQSASLEDIDRWHKANGWIGAGYNYYVRKDGSIYEMRGDNVGAQCLNYNSVSYGVCCEGDYEQYDTSMPDAQYNSLVDVLQWLKGRFPGAEIVGHKDLYATACPGQYFPLDEVKSLTPRATIIPWVDYNTILAAACSDPTGWVKFINNMTGDEVGKYLPTLIEKIYNYTKRGQI